MINLGEYWIITDLHKKIVAKGNPRNRWLQFILDEGNPSRVLIYGTRQKAISAYTDNWFLMNGEIKEYMIAEYNIVPSDPPYCRHKDFLPYMQAVKVSLMEID